MNDNQRLYLDQAKSDYEIFRFLGGRAPCHRLHYLQMCTEKLGKAYFYKRPPLSKPSHVGFVKFLRNLSTERNVWKALGFGRREDFELYINQIQHLARKIEKLAPDLAGDGPNPEYPWPPPPKEAKMAPIHYEFELWNELQKTRKGLKFQDFVERVLSIFSDWF